jgi:glycosyltransferase involved in cell wall biosynthesis
LHSIAVGGIASHVTELAAAVERAGHEIHVFTRRAPGQRYHDWIDGVHYHRCSYPRHHEFVDDVNNMCRSLVDRVFTIEDMVGRFDIVHAHDWLTANAMIWIKQGRDHKGVLTIHSTEYARCGNAFPAGRSVRVRDQEWAGTYWADQVICVSHATKKEVLWMYEVPDGKTQVVYNGVSSHRFAGSVDVGATRKRFDIGPMDPTILFCGRLEWQKGPDLLVQSIPRILPDHFNAKFVFVGDGAMRRDMETEARKLGVSHAVRFLGCRNGDEIVNLYKLADGVCVPSRNEPFGIVVLEAWSATSWPMASAFPAATSRSASLCLRRGVPGNRWSPPRSAAPPSSCSMSSTVCWSPLAWSPSPGASARCSPISSGRGGWARTAGGPSMSVSCGTPSPVRQWMSTSPCFRGP